MVTYDQLFEHLGRRPFQPFRVVLKSGEALEVVRTGQATVSRRLFVFGVLQPEQYFRFVQMSQVDRIEFRDLKQTG